MMSDLKFLVRSRGHLRAQITKKCSHVQDNYMYLSQQEITECELSLKDFKSRLGDLNGKIADLLWKEGDEDAFSGELESCDSYDDKIFTAVSRLKMVGTTNDGNRPNDKSGHIKYPTLPLPEYSHSEGESLEKFFKDFEKAMETMKVDPYIQFIYLQKQLGKQPLALVSSLSSTEQTYEEAKKLLQKAFGSEILRKFETLQSLSDLSLTYQSDPYAFIGKVRTIRNSFSALNITVENVLQFFIWNSLNDRFKLQLTQITNKNRPSLHEIEENLFEAAERYIALEKKSEKKGSSNKSPNRSTGRDSGKSTSS